MNIWILIIVLSFVAGGAVGFFKRGSNALLLGAGIPWLGLLAWLIFEEYWLAKGSGVWILAQLFGGTGAAVFGALGTWLTKKIFQNRLKGPNDGVAS